MPSNENLLNLWYNQADNNEAKFVEVTNALGLPQQEKLSIYRTQAKSLGENFAIF